MIATAAFTNGQILMGMTEVLEPVNAVHIAILISIPAEILNTIRDTLFVVPPRILIKRTNKPIKQSVNPSATHSIIIIFLLSDEIVPKLLTIPLTGMIWAIPHPMMIIEPIYINKLASISQPTLF